jgi:hypothetical protein
LTKFSDRTILPLNPEVKSWHRYCNIKLNDLRSEVHEDARYENIYTERFHKGPSLLFERGASQIWKDPPAGCAGMQYPVPVLHQKI